MSLVQYLDGLKGVTFQWGANDCMSLVSGALVAQGFDGLPDKWMGGYSNAWGATRHYTRLLQEAGQTDIIEAIDDLYERIVTLHPIDGSIAARPVDGDVLGHAFGVVFSGHVTFLTERGVAVDQVRHRDMFWVAS